jgi:hypothetical protein
VRVKQSKSFSLVDAISAGVDRMQRDFERMRKQVERWRQSEVTQVNVNQFRMTIRRVTRI